MLSWFLRNNEFVGEFVFFGLNDQMACRAALSTTFVHHRELLRRPSATLQSSSLRSNLKVADSFFAEICEEVLI